MEPRASGAGVRQSMGQVHDLLHAACAAMINSTCRHKSWAEFQQKQPSKRIATARGGVSSVECY